jgi:glycosyltransferase involved in cell wall biosynthesis
MKVLFVSSGNSINSINPIISNQGRALVSTGIVNIEYFTIKGKGIIGYLRNLKLLRKRIKNGNYNIIHAHYALSAYLASFAGAYPLVVSLMGSDVIARRINRLIIRLFSGIFNWSLLIVKSDNMKQILGYKKATVIPNGVDCERFKSEDRDRCKLELGWATNSLQILFAANPDRKEKNFSLLHEAIKLIDLEKQKVELHFLKDIPNSETPKWYNAADIVVLTSNWEGSPNVIKEAMACDRPVVSTRVGDVEWLFGDEPGYFIADFDQVDCARQLVNAINFAKEVGITNGRQRIMALGLSTNIISERIASFYQSIIDNDSGSNNN